MKRIPLILLGIIQIYTGATAFMNNADAFGIAVFPPELAHYRYMLTALWIPVGIYYLLGAVYEQMRLGATVLAAMNVLTEVAFYWKSDFPLWYILLATAVMGSLGLYCAATALRTVFATPPAAAN